MRPQDAFVHACRLDVAVRKPGNVSVASPGHGMHARLFVESARAACAPLFRTGAAVGARIEGAVGASLAVANCNTNLGIVLLCAPLAAALERPGAAASPAALRSAVGRVLQALDRDDARAAFRAIAAAHPGGLGRAQAQDVRAEPTVDLRAAMALAADRDTIARQYADGYAELFEHALARAGRLDAAAVRRVFLGWLAGAPDSHIVRKHGLPLAQTVMRAAQAESGREHDSRAWAAWDETLKAQGINPGTSADLTVATLFVAGLWHGS